MLATSQPPLLRGLASGASTARGRLASAGQTSPRPVGVPARGYKLPGIRRARGSAPCCTVMVDLRRNTAQASAPLFSSEGE